jgi:hypothetical protein
MRADKDLAPYFWRYREAWAPGEKETCWVAGDDGLVLDWLPEGLERLRRRLADADFLADVNAAFAEWGMLLGEIPESLKPKDEAREWRYEFRSPFAPDMDRFGKAKGLRSTLKKSGNARAYELSKDSLKKRILKAVTAEPLGEGQGWLVRVETAVKFSPEEFLRDAFALPAPEEWVRISAQARWLPEIAVPGSLEPSASAARR